VLWALVCALLPLATTRNHTVPAPVGPSTAIQYLVPAVTFTDVAVTEFQAPLTRVLIVPCVSRVPGLLLPVLVYSPATTCVAVLVLST
jgi:hypothetical protein